MQSTKKAETLRRKIATTKAKIDTLQSDLADLEESLSAALCPYRVGDKLPVPVGRHRGLTMEVVAVKKPAIASRGSWMIQGHIIRKRTGKPSLFAPDFYYESDFQIDNAQPE